MRVTGPVSVTHCVDIVFDSDSHKTAFTDSPRKLMISAFNMPVIELL